MRKVTDACNAGVCDTGRENCTVVSRKSNNMNDARNYADQPVRPTNEQQFLADDSDNKVVDETDYISEVSNLINGCGTDDSKKSIFAVKRIGDMNVTVVPAENPLIRKAAEEQILSDHDKQITGGHGRKKKLRPLEKYRKKEKNFREHYNHRLSKEIVNFAVKNHAKYINMENLSGYDASRFLERNWSYFDLQQKIIYKANQYGIIVRKVNPCYSSQVCSVCGNWHPENRPKGKKGQAYFCCHNKDCESHKFRNYNADYNASRNIAMADGVMIMNVFDGSKNENQKAKKITDEHRKIAREYYGFDDFYQEFKEQEKAKEKAKKEKSA